MSTYLNGSFSSYDLQNATMVFTSLCYSVYKSYLCQRQSTLNDWWKRDKRLESNIRVRRSHGWLWLWRGGPVLNSVLLTKQSNFQTDNWDCECEKTTPSVIFITSIRLNFSAHIHLLLAAAAIIMIMPFVFHYICIGWRDVGYQLQGLWERKGEGGREL